MKKINFTNCELDIIIPVDEDDHFDDSADGSNGYRVFYNVKESEKFFEQYRLTPEDFEQGINFAGGQLEFTVDKNYDLVENAEVLLWISSEEDGCCYNEEFVDYEEDISEFIIDLKFQKQ